MAARAGASADSFPNLSRQGGYLRLEQDFLDHEARELTPVPPHGDHFICKLLLQISQLKLFGLPLKVQSIVDPPVVTKVNPAAIAVNDVKLEFNYH